MNKPTSIPLNYDPADPDKMRLPAGVTCGDCVHIHRCKAMFGHVESDTTCDWSPSRFHPAAPAVASPRSSNDIYVECCRCRNKHWESERKEKPGRMGGVTVQRLVCPRCSAENYYRVDPAKWPSTSSSGSTPTSGQCRICGCTDMQACPGGCYWVEPDLCSACDESGLQP